MRHTFVQKIQFIVRILAGNKSSCNVSNSDKWNTSRERESRESDRQTERSPDANKSVSA